MNTFFQPNRRYFCSTMNLFFRRSEGIKSKEAYQRIECVVDTRTNVTVIKEGNNSLSALWTAKYLGIPSVSLSINFSLVFFPVILSSSSQCNAFTYIYISTGSAGACSFTIKDKNRVPSVLRFYVTTFLPSFFLFFSSSFFFFTINSKNSIFPALKFSFEPWFHGDGRGWNLFSSLIADRKRISVPSLFAYVGEKEVTVSQHVVVIFYDSPPWQD